MVDTVITVVVSVWCHYCGLVVVLLRSLRCHSGGAMSTEVSVVATVVDVSL